MKFQLRPFADGPAADDIPIELDRVIRETGKSADYQVQSRYPPGSSLLGVAR